MLLYTSRKTASTSHQEFQQFPNKKQNSGSFTEKLQPNNNGAQQPISAEDEEDNGEVHEESPDGNKEIAPIPITKSKSRERQVNPSIQWGAIMNKKSCNEVESIQPVFKSNLIYKSSPTKATQKFGQVTRLIDASQDPLNLLQPQKSKNVYMFKPTKLSSTMTEDQNTPEKGLKQVVIDITIDLSGRDLNQVPLLETLFTDENYPTIIDLRLNNLKEVPAALFQLPSLKQLRLDSNNLTALPESLNEPHKCRISVLTLSQNHLIQLPTWIYYHVRHSLDRLDVSLNPQFSVIPDAICNLDKLTVLLIFGCNIVTLPQGITRLQRIEEFGLEWWQYISIDETTFQKKEELGIIRDDTVITNRQVLRQIFETLRQVNQSHIQTGPKRIDFISFYRQYKRLYPIYNKEKEKPAKVQTLFQLICHFGHTHLINQLINYSDHDFKPNLNKGDSVLQGQTLFQVALHLSHDEEFLIRLIDYAQPYLSSFDFYNLRPNEELPIQRQLQLLHPLMIVLKRKYLKVFSQIFEFIKTQLSSDQLHPFDLRDENRNTLFHHLFSLFQEDLTKMPALSLCEDLIANQTILELKLNETNKQGMTPLDLAIELRINDAVAFALQSNRLQNHKFNVNSNGNQRGLSPVHRAVQARNHQALLWLLETPECNPILRDKDFKKPRDYCQRLLFMQKLLKKAELALILKPRDQQSPTCKEQQTKAVHKWINLKSLKTNQIQQKEDLIRLHNNIAINKSMKRSASEIRDLKNFTPSGALIMNPLIITDQDAPRRPFIIERPIPLDRFTNLHYNKTVVENIIKPTAFLLDFDDSQEDDNLVKNEYQVRSNTKNPIINFSNKKQLQQRPPTSTRLSGRQKSQKKTKKGSGMKPKITQHEQVRKSMDRTTPGFTEDLNEEFRYTSRNTIGGTAGKGGEISEFNTFVGCEEADASEESPITTMPSNQFHYVMTVNHSKLARKPYYKKLLKNAFEPEFCDFMDAIYGQVVCYDYVPKKLSVLYKVFHKATGFQRKDKRIMRDALEFFQYLMMELSDPCEGPFIRPYMHEIIYLRDRLTEIQENEPNNEKDVKMKFKSQENSQRDISLRLKTATTPNLKSLRLPTSHQRSSQHQKHTKNNGSGAPSFIPSKEDNNYSQNNLIHVKSLRQSVSLKSLMKGNQSQQEKNNEKDNNEKVRNSQVGYGKNTQLHYLSHKQHKPLQQQRGTTHDFSKMTRLIEESNSQLIFEQALLSPGDEEEGKSPKLDTGQIASKRHLVFEQAPSDLMSTPGGGPQGTSSEQSLQSKEKRLQVLDASVRTVSINIDAPSSREDLRKKGQRMNLSQPQMITEDVTTPFSVPENTFNPSQIAELLSSGGESLSQKVSKLSQQVTPPIAVSVLAGPVTMRYSGSITTNSTSQNRKYTNKFVSGIPVSSTHIIGSTTTSTKARKGGIASSLGNSGTSRAATQLQKGKATQRSISSTHRASALSGSSRTHLSNMHNSSNNHKSPSLHALIQQLQRQPQMPNTKRKTNTVQSVPQSIQINLGRREGEQMIEDEEYYKMLMSKHNPCS